MLEQHLYQFSIIKTKHGAYAYRSVRWAESCNDEIVDYATTNEMAHNLTIDYIQHRKNGTQFPMQHSMVYYERLSNGGGRRYKYLQTQKWGRLWDFSFQCRLEEQRQFYEQLKARRELKDDLWKARNRNVFIAGFRRNAHPESIVV